MWFLQTPKARKTSTKQHALTLTAAVLLAATTSTLPAMAATLAPAAPVLQVGTNESAATAPLSGTWHLTWTGKKGQQRHKTVQLQQSGDTLSGSARSKEGPMPVAGTVHGDQVAFDMKLPKRQISFNGTFDGTRMSGTTRKGLPWSATRS